MSLVARVVESCHTLGLYCARLFFGAFNIDTIDHRAKLRHVLDNPHSCV